MDCAFPLLHGHNLIPSFRSGLRRRCVCSAQPSISEEFQWWSEAKGERAARGGMV